MSLPICNMNITRMQKVDVEFLNFFMVYFVTEK